MTGLEGIYLEELIHGGAYFRNFMVFCFSISRRFRPFYDTSGLLQKISEGYRRLQIMGKTT